VALSATELVPALAGLVPALAGLVPALAGLVPALAVRCRHWYAPASADAPSDRGKTQERTSLASESAALRFEQETEHGAVVTILCVTL
jgi:hypothetical protein